MYCPKFDISGRPISVFLRGSQSTATRLVGRHPIAIAMFHTWSHASHPCQSFFATLFKLNSSASFHEKQIKMPLPIFVGLVKISDFMPFIQ